VRHIPPVYAPSEGATELSDERKSEVLTLPSGGRGAGFIRREIRSAVFRLLRRAKYLLGREPVFLPILLRLTPLGTSRQITDSTDLVVEGFPRSGNTFMTFAIEDASDHSLQIASHVHQPSQVKLALARGLPTVLVIREPLAALSSYLVYGPHFSASGVIKEYCSYHRQLLPYVEWLLICEFSDVTTEMSSVIDRINHRYSMTIPPFNQSPSNIEHLLTQIVRQHKLVHPHLDAVQGAPSPFADRRESSERMRQELRSPGHEAELAEATELYEYFSGVASEQKKLLQKIVASPNARKRSQMESLRTVGSSHETPKRPSRAEPTASADNG
jgi:hypothetical protein